MELKEVATSILLDCDVIVGVDLINGYRLKGIGLEVSYLPVSESGEAKTQKSRLFIRRKHAEKLLDLLMEALNRPETRTLN